MTLEPSLNQSMSGDRQDIVTSTVFFYFAFPYTYKRKPFILFSMRAAFRSFIGRIFLGGHLFFCEKSNWSIVLVSKPGGGVPDALQLRVTGSFLATVMSRGFSIMTGLLPSPLSAVASAVNGIAAKIKNAKSVYAEVLFYFFAHENRLPSMGSSDQHLYQWDKKNRPCSKAACYPRRCGGGWLFRAKKM